MQKEAGIVYRGAWKDLPDDFQLQWYDPDSEQIAKARNVKLIINKQAEKPEKKYLFQKDDMRVLLLRKNRTVEDCLQLLKVGEPIAAREKKIIELKNDSQVIEGVAALKAEVSEELGKGLGAAKDEDDGIVD